MAVPGPKGVGGESNKFSVPEEISATKVQADAPNNIQIKKLGELLLNLNQVPDISYAEVQINRYKDNDWDYSVHIVMNVDQPVAETALSDVSTFIENSLTQLKLHKSEVDYFKKIRLKISLTDDLPETRRNYENTFRRANKFKNVSVRNVKLSNGIKFNGGYFSTTYTSDYMLRFFYNQKESIDITQEGYKLLDDVVKSFVLLFGTKPKCTVKIQTRVRSFGKSKEEDMQISTGRASILALELIDKLRKMNAELGPIILIEEPLGSTRPIISKDSTDDRNNFTDIFVAGRVAEVKIDNKSSVVTVNGNSKNNSEKKDSVIIVDKQRDILSKSDWRRLQFLMHLGARFNFLKGHGTADAYLPGGQFDIKFGYNTLLNGRHALSLGLIVGLGLTGPFGRDGNLTACYPEEISGDSAAGCLPDVNNKRLSLVHGIHVTPGVYLTYGTVSDSYSLSLSLLTQIHHDRYSVEKNNDAQVVAPDIAAYDSELVQNSLMMGGEIALSFPASDFFLFKRIGFYIRCGGPLLNLVHDGPGALHFPYSKGDFQCEIGLISGSEDFR